MNYLTKSKSGAGLQYTGDNLLDLIDFFPEFEINILRSSHTFKGSTYSDLKVVCEGKEADLLVGDYLMIMNDDTWEVIPMEEFNSYWEEI